MQLKPIGRRITVLPDETPDTTPGGIMLLPDPAQQRAERGTVVAVGPLVTEVGAGNVVHFGKFTGESGKVEGGPENLLVMYVDEILAVEVS